MQMKYHSNFQNASTQRSEMEVLQKKAAEENKQLEKRKAVIDKELAEVNK